MYFSSQVIMSRSLCFKSKIGPESFLSEIGDQPYFLKNFSNTISTSNDCSGVRFQDLYNYIDVKLNDFKVWFLLHVISSDLYVCNLSWYLYHLDCLLLQITIVNSDQSQKISILEKFAASFFMAFCVIPDESILKQLEVISRLDVVDWIILSLLLWCDLLLVGLIFQSLKFCDLSVSSSIQNLTN